MAKVFTITEGLENLGALKSGGQGSVYKARKTGEIITAIKILPTPIASETDDDRHFTSFQNEVQKLKKVNEIPNPNVVSIIASGITSTGNLPYIEMEYIEGPDLGELLKPPYDPVFTIKETIRVADQLSNALAHCHRAGIKHGDIKSNNIKFNGHTGNYILLDFGLSVMSDEQRRTSIRYAGAIEFMAPEQSKGETLFETDVYSFGIILFELLAGIVPFPLTNKGEIARNAVMLAHMETLPPDIITLRRQMLSDLWSNEKAEREMQVPLWLMTMIYRCLEKNPAARFSSGIELQEFIQGGMLAEERNKTISITAPAPVLPEVDNTAWKKEILKLQLQLSEKDELLNDLQSQVNTKEKELYELRYSGQLAASTRSGVSKSLFVIVLIIALGFAGFAAYNKLHVANKTVEVAKVTPVESKMTGVVDSAALPVIKAAKKVKSRPKKILTGASSTLPDGKKLNRVDSSKQNEKRKTTRANEYTIISKAYFYSSPDKESRRNIFLTAGNITFTTIEEKNDFVYVVIAGEDGKTTKGWLLKADFIPANEY